MGLSIIVPTSGRPTLSRTLDSIASQLASGDEIIVICDTNAKWGNASRDKAMQMATGSHLAFLDDDDVYAPGALDLVRGAVSEWPEHIHIFRMHSPQDNSPWNSKQIHPGNLGTPMVVWPNVPGFPLWAESDAGTSDFHFIEKSIGRLQRQLIWHEEVLAIVRPE